MTEKLGLGQGVRQGAAVDLDQRSVGARAVVMDPSGDGGFAGAGFPLDQHGGQVSQQALVGGHDFFQVSLHAGEAAAEEEVVAGFVPLDPTMLVQPGMLLLLPSPGEDQGYLHRFKRFHQIVQSTQPHRLHGAVDLAVGSHDDHTGVLGELSFLQPVGSAAVRQVDVQQQEVEIDTVHGPLGCLQGSNRCGVGPQTFDLCRELSAQQRFILDDQNAQSFEIRSLHGGRILTGILGTGRQKNRLFDQA